MASSVDVTHILCVGDSRLRHLQSQLNNNMRGIHFSCYVFPGATLGHLSYQLRLLLQHTEAHYAFIVILGGICDLTILSREPTKRLTPAYNSVQSMIDNYERIFALFCESAALFTQTPIIYVPLVGVHFSRYSGDDQSVFQYQPIIDQSIPLINYIIRTVNTRHGLPTPNVAHSIHHCHGKGGRYRTRYCRLIDGCHPDTDTRLLWSQEILKAMTNLIYAWPPS